jgi:lipopolysaccharide biosynthesis regulator YciM
MDTIASGESRSHQNHRAILTALSGRPHRSHREEQSDCLTETFFVVSYICECNNHQAIDIFVDIVEDREKGECHVTLD